MLRHQIMGEITIACFNPALTKDTPNEAEARVAQSMPSSVPDAGNAPDFSADASAQESSAEAEGAAGESQVSIAAGTPGTGTQTKGSKPPTSLSKLRAFLAENTIADINKLFYVKTCVLGKGSILYIPSGWMCIELFSQGPLVYGVGKSLFIDREECKTAYSKAKELMAADKRNVDRMEAVLNKFS